jgi:hypothetical protein
MVAVKITASRGSEMSVSQPGERPRNRYELAKDQDARRKRQEAQAFLKQRPLGQFLIIQFAWGCLGALLGILLLDSWMWAAIDFIIFAGAGFIAREFIRRRYVGGDSGPGETSATGA